MPYARYSLVVLGLVYLMILSGGLVAGTRAGFAYSTWPLMGPTFVPEAVYSGTPAWLDAFEDVTTIQFNHRMFAYLLFVLIHAFAFLVFRGVREPLVRWGALLVVIALWIQVLLGISTLLLHVPVPLAAAHQGGAVTLLSGMVFLSYLLAGRPSLKV